MKKEKIPNEENNYRPSETSAEEYGILDYLHDFKSNKEIQKSAFDLAHGIRKFEIDLYWKRAAYFWAFISVALAGFALVESKDFASKKNAIPSIGMHRIHIFTRVVNGKQRQQILARKLGEPRR